jgi:methylated-DNA-protein-cysteine methyltransferase related protein
LLLLLSNQFILQFEFQYQITKLAYYQTMHSSTFFSDVYEVVQLIPRGRVTSYGAIANYLGATKSARLVGYAMNAAHALPNVPAHRVVNRTGMLTGKHHFATPTRMQELLEAEGVEIKNDQVVDFEKLFWDPMVELKL